MFTVSLLLSSSLTPDASTSAAAISVLEKADMFSIPIKPFPLPMVVEFSSVRCFEK
jgi:hypothetical protein